MLDRPLHILHLASWYPHGESRFQGIFVQRQIEAVASDHTCSVIHVVGSADEKDAIDCKEINGVFTAHATYKKVTSTLPVYAGWKKMKHHLRVFQKAYDAVVEKNGTPDLIHLHVIFPAGIQALHLLKIRKVPLVVSEHWSGYLSEDGNYKGLFMKQLTTKVVEKAARVLTVSKPMQAAMLRHDLRNQYFQVPNVVDTTLFSLNVENILPMQIVHVSTVNDREKNISGMIKAFAKVVQQLPEARLKIIGDGPELPTFKSLAGSLGLSKMQIEFTGLLTPAAVAKSMQESTFLLLPSNYEGLPCVILEALCCGTPILATEVGGIPEIITPSNGMLVPLGDEGALVQGMLKMIESAEEFHRAEIAASAQKQYSYEVVGKILAQHYQEVLVHGK